MHFKHNIASFISEHQTPPKKFTFFWVSTQSHAKSRLVTQGSHCIYHLSVTAIKAKACLQGGGGGKDDVISSQQARYYIYKV